MSAKLVDTSNSEPLKFAVGDRAANSPAKFKLPNLIWPVSISSGILFLLGIVGAWYVLQLQTASSDILAWNVTSIRAATELEISVREIRSQLNRFLMSGDKRLLEELPRLNPNWTHWLAESIRLARNPGEKIVIEQAAKEFEHFLSEIARIQQLENVNDQIPQVRELVDDVLRDKILNLAHKYLQFNEIELATSSEHNQILAVRLAISLALIGICGATAGLLAGYGLAKGIERSIVQVQVPIHDVAGQLSEVVGPISVSNVERLEDLDAALRLIAGRVTEVIEKLRQREREALRSEQLAALGQLAAGLAHELRNPLMSMKILVQSAQSDVRGQLEGPDLDVLDDEIVRLEKLVSTFLDFARPTEPKKRSINLSAVIRQTLELISHQVRVRGITVHFSSQNKDVYLAADAGQMRQILLNLLLNSLDASHDGGTIWVSCAHCTSDGPQEFAEVVVADNGVGLPDQLRDSIFDPFVSTKSVGIGLGLTICRRIASAHNGTITAASRPDGGAQFTLRLPLELNQPAAGTPNSASRNTPPAPFSKQVSPGNQPETTPPG